MFLRAIKNDIASKKNKKSGDYSSWVSLAEQWEAKGNYKWAYLCYVRALRKAKDNKELHRAKALCCLKLGKNYMYLNIMKTRVLLSPIPEDFLPDVIQCANLYKESKKPEMAAELLEKAFLDMKNGKLAFQLFMTLEETRNHSKIIDIYHSHYQLLKSTELSVELEIFYLISLINTPAPSAKEMDRSLQTVLRGIDSAKLHLGAKLAEEFRKRGNILEAERVYMRLSEFPQAPIFPQVVVLFTEMGDYRKALRMVKLWKKVGTPAERVQIMKHETEISSRLMRPLIKLDGDENPAGEDIDDAVSISEDEDKFPRKTSHEAVSRKHSYTPTNARRSKRFKPEEENEDEKFPLFPTPTERNPKIIETMEKLLEEWNSEKVKGRNDPKTVGELCETIEALLGQEAAAFV